MESRWRLFLHHSKFSRTKLCTVDNGVAGEEEGDERGNVQETCSWTAPKLIPFDLYVMKEKIVDGHKIGHILSLTSAPGCQQCSFSPPYDNNEIFPGPMFADGKKSCWVRTIDLECGIQCS